MSEEQDYLQRLGEYHLEAQYNAEYQEVVITGSDVALQHLRDTISWLIDAGKPGSHAHLDRATGLKGNVSSLVIGKRSES